MKPLYGRSDIDDVSVSLKDGTAHHHTRTKKMQLPNGKPGPFLLECEACCDRLIEIDPSITTKSLDPNVRFTTHWAATAKAVPQSEAEKDAEEEVQKAFMAGNYADFDEYRKFRDRNRQRAINVAQ